MGTKSRSDAFSPPKEDFHPSKVRVYAVNYKLLKKKGYNYLVENSMSKVYPRFIKPTSLGNGVENRYLKCFKTEEKAKAYVRYMLAKEIIKERINSCARKIKLSESLIDELLNEEVEQITFTATIKGQPRVDINGWNYECHHRS